MAERSAEKGHELESNLPTVASVHGLPTQPVELSGCQKITLNVVSDYS